MITTYLVTGMTCQHCVNSVTEEVSSIPGVNEVNVNLETGSMEVTSNGEVPDADIFGAVAEAGDYVVSRI